MLRLEELRKNKGISQETLAKDLNMTQQRISAYEKGKREPDIETLKQFAEYFNCTIDYITGKTDVRNPGKQIDDVLNEAMIGMSKEDYEKLTDVQKKQIRDFALFVKNQNEKGKK